MADTKTVKNKAVQANREVHPEYENLAVELQFELLKQFAWLGSAIIGGIVVLIQLGKVDLGGAVYLGLACFALSVLVSVQGQDYLVGKLTEGQTINQLASIMKKIRMFAFGLIFFGAGIMVSQLAQL